MRDNSLVDWDEPGLLARFLELANGGLHTNVQIARIMTAEYGHQFNKNIVIGKRRRLQRATLVPKPKPPEPAEPAQLPLPLPEPTPRKRPKPGEPVTFEQLRFFHCRFPYGTWPEISFCGHPIEFGSYCLKHYEHTHFTPRKTWA